MLATYKLGPATCLAPGPRGTESYELPGRGNPIDAGGLPSSQSRSLGASDEWRDR